MTIFSVIGRLVVPACLLLLQPTHLSGQQDPAGPISSASQGIWADLEVQQPTYLSGDTVRIHIRLINRTDNDAAIEFAPPQYMFRLMVTRNGQPVRPETDVENTAGITLAVYELKPNTPREISSIFWLPLTMWGYRIREPGDYAIQAIPHMYSLRGHLIQDTSEVRSNKARFTFRRK